MPEVRWVGEAPVRWRACAHDTLPMQASKTHLGGTMRLGKRRTVLSTTSCTSRRLYELFGQHNGPDCAWVDERPRLGTVCIAHRTIVSRDR